MDSAPRGSTTIHLVRHGEVENPRGVIYGRLPGFHLSARGKRQADDAARRLTTADIGLVWASPLERAQETAAAIAAPHGLEVVTDARLIESETTLEGTARGLLALAISPRRWWNFRNPMLPTWGESFVSIRARMTSAIADALIAAGGRQAVLVSHQTPVRVAAAALGRRGLPPWAGVTPCHTGSITTLVVAGGRVVAASYYRPPG